VLTIEVCCSPAQVAEHSSRVVPGFRCKTKITLAMFCLRRIVRLGPDMTRARLS
jgi:hypothetical protein